VGGIGWGVMLDETVLVMSSKTLFLIVTDCDPNLTLTINPDHLKS